MSKHQWINEVYDLLCQSQGAPENMTERDNLMSWARAMAENYFDEGMSPQEAHDEEVSCS